MDTSHEEYTRYLARVPLWKRVIPVQMPYRLHIRSLRLGNVLDIGCGVGRNLQHLAGTGACVGIDHNPTSVAIAVSRGLTAFTPETFLTSSFNRLGSFDALLLAHVVEHLTDDESVALINTYLPYVRVGGRLVVIAPQRAGFKSDATHVTYVDFPKAKDISEAVACTVSKQYSFPFPQVVGNIFTYNEHVTVATKNSINA